MPVISMFYGLIIRMFFLDTDRHKAPHIHVQYAEQTAVIRIPDGVVLEGELKASKMRLVLAWIENPSGGVDGGLSARGRGPAGLQGGALEVT